MTVTAPSHAPPATQIVPAPPNMSTASAPTEAPPETPKTDGSAKGLRVKTCKRLPDIANKPPTAKAARTLGKRNW